MQVTGEIKLVNPEQTFGSNGFRKRELVVVADKTTDYPQPIMIEFTQDKCDLLNNFNVGQDVTVSINLRGREWINPQGEAKYFNSVQGWRIEANTDAPTASAESQSAPLPASNEPDGLPF